MGVNNLWKALTKEHAVKTYEGSSQHASIVAEVENKVVAVDMSAWLMQAQTQPALLEHYDSDYARAVKVVFDRTIHWLRYGCLPVFVIEGETPAAKLDKLRQRCVAQYGPSARSYSVGNRSGGQFDRLGQAVRRLLEAFGVPCVQAVGEGEAMCAALNLCGWCHACHTLDVDVLLFGALTVFKQMHLQTDDPRRSVLSVCSRGDVQRVLGIKRGGDAALVAVAQLAGGDYDVGGADNVGEALALGAVRCLLRGCESDEDVLQRLDKALATGPDPQLDALTKCTGCKACGHEGGMKTRITQHSARHGGCAACGCADGCVRRQWQECECAFHRRADERLLNRVVRRATATPEFASSCRAAAATYAQQVQASIAAVQREYGLPIPGSSRNVFTWQKRPDVAAISELMCRYIKEWDHHQVRLKLLPLLLEWDVRQGPTAGPSSGVQFRPIGIRKVSGRGAEDSTGVPARQQQGWRYVLLVERLQQQDPAAAADDRDAEDLGMDLSWLAGTVRSRGPRPAASQLAGGGSSLRAADTVAAARADPADAADSPPDEGGGMWLMGSQSGIASSQVLSQSLSQPGGSQAGGGGVSGGAGGASGGGGGARSGGGRGSEHRSVRCSLMEAVWPDLVSSYRHPPASSGKGRSGGSRKKAAGTATPGKLPRSGIDSAAAAAGREVNQHSLKDYFGVVKDYAAPSKVLCQAGRPPSAAGDSVIPGLAGITVGPASDTKQLAGKAGADFAAGALGTAAAVQGQEAAETGIGGSHHSSTKQLKPHSASDSSFMKWLRSEAADAQHSISQQTQQHKQQQQLSSKRSDVDGDEDAILPFSPCLISSKTAAAAAAAAEEAKADAAFGQSNSRVQRVFVGIKGHDSRAAAVLPAAAAALSSGTGRTSGRLAASGRGRAVGKAKACMPAGALERFLKPSGSPSRQRQEQLPKPCTLQNLEGAPKQHMLEEEGALASPSIIDCCSSPEVAPLAARLAASYRRGPSVATSSAAGVANHPAPPEAPAVDEPPSKKQCSPQKAVDVYLPAAAMGISMPADSRQQPVGGRAQQRLFQQADKQQQMMARPLALFQQDAAHAAGKSLCSSAAAAHAHRPPAGMSAAYLALLHEVGALSPPQQQQWGQQQPEQQIISLLDTPDANPASQQQQQQQEWQQEQQQQQQSVKNDVIDLT